MKNRFSNNRGKLLPQALLCLLLIAYSLPAISQITIPTQTWYESKFFSYCHDPNNQADGYLILEDNNQNIYGIGLIKHPGALENDILLIKYDLDGNILWTKSISSTFAGILTSIIYEGEILSDGNILLSIRIPNTYHLVKIDANSGAIIWAKFLDGHPNALNTRFEDMEATDDGGFIAVRSYKDGNNSSLVGFELTKWNTNGSLEWYRASTRDVTGVDATDFVPVDVDVNYDGTIAVLGKWLSNDAREHRLGLHKTDPMGNMTSFSYLYDVPDVDWGLNPKGLAALSPYVYRIISNMTYLSGDGLLTYQLVNGAGTQIAQKSHVGDGISLGVTRAQDHTKSSVAVGNTNLLGLGNSDGFMVTLGILGDANLFTYDFNNETEVFRYISGGNGNRSLIIGSGGGKLLTLKAGAAANGGTPGCDVSTSDLILPFAAPTITKANIPMTSVQNTNAYGKFTSLTFTITDLTLDCNRTCHEEGEWRDNGPVDPIKDVREKWAGPSPEAAAEISLYPNPAASQLTLSYNLEGFAEASMITYDLTGRVLLHQSVNTDGQEKVIDVSGLAPGAYFFELKAEGSTVFYKKILIAR